jgi:hypothetical protein
VSVGTERRFLLKHLQPNPDECAMHYTFSNRLKHFAAVFLFSGFAAGGISALTSPVTAGNTARVTISINRANKSDRLPLPPIVGPTQGNSIFETPVPGHARLDCEPAFSPITDPGLAYIINYCLA